MVSRCYSVKCGMSLAYVPLVENLKSMADIYFLYLPKNLEYMLITNKLIP